ncbi:hypothetical protein Nmel_009810, partial [Mimus melanotis]
SAGRGGAVTRHGGGAGPGPLPPPHSGRRARPTRRAKLARWSRIFAAVAEGSSGSGAHPLRRDLYEGRQLRTAGTT